MNEKHQGRRINTLPHRSMERKPAVEEINILREQLRTKEAELMHVQLALIESKITNLEHNDADREARLRIVETSRIRFETLAWLVFGGGALSLINVIAALIGRI